MPAEDRLAQLKATSFEQRWNALADIWPTLPADNQAVIVNLAEVLAPTKSLDDDADTPEE